MFMEWMGVLGALMPGLVNWAGTAGVSSEAISTFFEGFKVVRG